MAIFISKPDQVDEQGTQGDPRRRTIRVTGVHKKRMLEVINSDAKPNAHLREAIKIARSARK